MGMIYEWRADSRFPVGAQIAAERLSAIKSDRGAITPRYVLDDAASDNSPLHKCFEWNNEKAADNYRLDQARKLIGAIVVAKIDDAPVKKETRAFVHSTIEGNQYVPIQVAMSRSDMRAETLGRAKQEIAMWRARYAAYSEFAELHARIDSLLAAEPVAA